MFNKKKFNRKEGESRVCNSCSVTFHTMKPRWTCPPCVNKKHRIERNIQLGNGPTDAYAEKMGRKPDLERKDFDDRRREWNRKSSWLQRHVKDRTEWQAFFKGEFERIRNDEPLWRSLTRETLGMTKPKPTEETKLAVGRPSEKDNHPMSWEDYEASGWNLPEDD
jgi:hypothetical protein